MWAGQPEEIGSSRFILCGLATLTGSSRFILCGLATLTGSSRFILCGLATLTGSSRLILLCWPNQKRLVPPGRHWIWGEKGGNHRGLPKCASMRTEKLSCNWRSRKNQWCLVQVTTVGKKLSRNRRRGEDYLHSMVPFRLSFSPMRGI